MPYKSHTYLSFDQAVTLSGRVVPGPCRVKVTDFTDATIVVGVNSCLLESNPSRISAVIHAPVTNTANLLLYLEGMTYPFYLAPGGFIKFDRDFPFTGSVQSLGVAVALAVVLEMSLE